MAVLVVKIGLKLGASQLGASIPHEALSALDSVTDDLLHSTLSVAAQELGEVIEPQLESAFKVKERTEKAMSLDVPEDAIGKLAADQNFVKLSANEFKTLKAWMDKTQGARWEAKCGLVKTMTAESKIAWVPERVQVA